MTKPMMLERLGFFLARVLIFQAGNDSWKSDTWNSVQNGSLILVELEDQQSLKLEMRSKQDRPLFLKVNNRNVD